MVGNAIAQSAQPIISYNFGLGYKERVVATERIALLTSVVSGIVIMAAFSLFPHILVGLFINPNNPAARIAHRGGIPISSTAFIFFILNLYRSSAIIQSVERVKPATLFALCCGFIFLIPSFLLLPEILGNNGIWLALSFSEVLTTVTILVVYGNRPKGINDKRLNNPQAVRKKEASNRKPLAVVMTGTLCVRSLLSALSEEASSTPPFRSRQPSFPPDHGLLSVPGYPPFRSRPPSKAL